jgi:hypothetical protein
MTRNKNWANIITRDCDSKIEDLRGGRKDDDFHDFEVIEGSSQLCSLAAVS